MSEKYERKNIRLKIKFRIKSIATEKLQLMIS